MDKFNVRVIGRSTIATNIVALTLAGVDGQSLPAAEAGAHIEVVTPSGAIRQYSVCNAPEVVNCYRLAVLNATDSRGGSRSMCENVSTGDIIQISAPRNNFPLQPDSSKAYLIAGGIGITPILAMGYELLRKNAPFEVHYSARSASASAFLDEITRGALGAHTRLYFDDHGEAFNPSETLADAAKSSHLYVCGPHGFIDFVHRSAIDLGWNKENIHRELFTAPASPSGENLSFEVQLASTGQVLEVQSNETIAQALQAHGIDVTLSCEQGVCGTCVTSVISGYIDHRDSYLTDADRQRGDSIMVCCSRAKAGRLVLDI
ncbi:PDR/VanB family oxidoreductase [Paraburkholderia aspalathi]|uniref:PDR/VanB family oxidoreductase n=1 Tax=Paraburkholderia aspalathi TaxID=1324617 RepID=UPI003CA32937